MALHPGSSILKQLSDLGEQLDVFSAADATLVTAPCQCNNPAKKPEMKADRVPAELAGQAGQAGRFEVPAGTPAEVRDGGFRRPI